MLAQIVAEAAAELCLGRNFHYLGVERAIEGRADDNLLS